MSDSSSDESSIVEIQKQAAATKSKKQAPCISFTGSSRQPMSLDSDSDENSDASSELEILPPVKKKKKAPKAAAAAKKPTDTDSDSDDSFLVSKTTKVAKKKPASYGDSSDSDSDDSFLDVQETKKKADAPKKKKALSEKQLAHRAQQARQKADRLAAKKANQARRKEERERTKQQKAAQKEVEKATKKRQRLEGQQARGNFATQEIVLLVDPPLHNRPDHGCYNWKENDEITNHNCMVQEYRSALVGSNCHALQWIRRDHLKGGAQEAWKQLQNNNHHEYTHLERLVIVMDDPKVFIDLLHRTPQDDTDDDYPLLREWLIRLEAQWNAAWPHATANRPTILLLLLSPLDEIDRQWTDYRKRNRNSRVGEAEPTPPKEEEFHDAKTWMLIQFQVECMCLNSYEEIWTQALKMTRAMAKQPYQNQLTELECIKRLKPMCDDNAPPLIKAKDTWLRMLRQIPGISEAKARKLVQHYPTIQSLWQAYQAEGEEDPEDIVAGCLSNRYEQKMGEVVYKLLTSTDPSEILS